MPAKVGSNTDKSESLGIFFGLSRSLELTTAWPPYCSRPGCDTHVRPSNDKSSVVFCVVDRPKSSSRRRRIDMPAVGLPSNNPRFWSCRGPASSLQSLTTERTDTVSLRTKHWTHALAPSRSRGPRNRVRVPRIQLAEEPHAATAAAHTRHWHLVALFFFPCETAS